MTDADKQSAIDAVNAHTEAQGRRQAQQEYADGMAIWAFVAFVALVFCALVYRAAQ